MLQPSKELIQKFAPIISKIVGAFFIIDGIIALLLILPIFLLGNGEENIFFVSALCFAALVSIAIGTVVFKFFPKFLLSIYVKNGKK